MLLIAVALLFPSPPALGMPATSTTSTVEDSPPSLASTNAKHYIVCSNIFTSNLRYAFLKQLALLHICQITQPKVLL